MVINMYTLMQLYILYNLHVCKFLTVDRSRECLKHFVVVLTERKLIRDLCNYTYCGMEEEVEYSII